MIMDILLGSYAKNQPQVISYNLSTIYFIYTVALKLKDFSCILNASYIMHSFSIWCTGPLNHIGWVTYSNFYLNIKKWESLKYLSLKKLKINCKIEAAIKNAQSKVSMSNGAHWVK